MTCKYHQTYMDIYQGHYFQREIIDCCVNTDTHKVRSCYHCDHPEQCPDFKKTEQPFDREMEQTEHNYLPGEHVLHQGEEAEVVDVYPKSIMIRIGRNTYKTVLPGQVEPCGPDGGSVPGNDVRFG